MKISDFRTTEITGGGREYSAARPNRGTRIRSQHKEAYPISVQRTNMVIIRQQISQKVHSSIKQERIPIRQQNHSPKQRTIESAFVIITLYFQNNTMSIPQTELNLY